MDDAMVGAIFASAFLPSNPAPMVISARGCHLRHVADRLIYQRRELNPKQSHDQSCQDT